MATIIALEKDPIDEFDKHIGGRNYKNRSEAIRKLIRADLIIKQWLCNVVAPDRKKAERHLWNFPSPPDHPNTLFYPLVKKGGSVRPLPPLTKGNTLRKLIMRSGIAECGRSRRASGSGGVRESGTPRSDKKLPHTSCLLRFLLRAYSAFFSRWEHFYHPAPTRKHSRRAYLVAAHSRGFP